MHRCREPTWRPAAGGPGPAATSPRTMLGPWLLLLFCGGTLLSGEWGLLATLGGGQTPRGPFTWAHHSARERWRMAGHSSLWPGCSCQGLVGPARGREAAGAKARDAGGRGPWGHAGSPTAGVSEPCWGDRSGLSPEPGTPTGPLGSEVPRGGQRVCRACGHQVQRARADSRVLTVTVTTTWALASAPPPVKVGETQPPHMAARGIKEVEGQGSPALQPTALPGAGGRAPSPPAPAPPPAFGPYNCPDCGNGC